MNAVRDSNCLKKKTHKLNVPSLKEAFEKRSAVSGLWLKGRMTGAEFMEPAGKLPPASVFLTFEEKDLIFLRR